MVGEENIELTDEQKHLFLNTLNKKGFFLEDKAWKILHGMSSLSPIGLERNKTIDFDKRRVDIDLLQIKGNKTFLIECKRTDYTWIFPKAMERLPEVNIIIKNQEGCKVCTSQDIDVKPTWMEIAMLFKDGSFVKKNQNDDVGRTAYSDAHDAIKQCLKNTEAYLNVEKVTNGFLFPIVVTNAKLLWLNYSKGNLNDDGDLIEFESLRPIKWVGFNHAETMTWDRNSQVIYNSDPTKRNDHTKTVFIVNIFHLKDFICYLERIDI